MRSRGSTKEGSKIGFQKQSHTQNSRDLTAKGGQAPVYTPDSVCVDVTIEWAYVNKTFNPCNLTWDLRLIEESLPNVYQLL